MSADAEHARLESRQLPIFPRDSRTVCAELHLGWHEARRLHEDGWLSFDPEANGVLDESRDAELMFIGSLVGAGLSRPALRQLLAGLRKPYCYDVRRLYFDWQTHEWRLLPGEHDPEGAFFALLDRLRERDAVEVLQNIRGWVDEALDLARDRTHLFAHGGRNGYGSVGSRPTD